MDRATVNLPSADFDQTERFYAAVGFATRFRDHGWIILQRGAVELEFFPHPVNPLTTIARSGLRVDDLDGLRNQVRSKQVQMAQIEGDFEKGFADGAEASLKVISLTAQAWRRRSE